MPKPTRRKSRKPAPKTARTKWPRPPKPTVALPEPGALLMTRAQATVRLGISTETLRRLEKAGLLTPIKISPGTASRTHYHVEAINALAQNGHGGNGE